jgi:alanine racemase
VFRSTVAHINLGAIRANYELVRSLAPQGRAVAVIKADAYGHGMLPVAEALTDVADAFAVATVDEAVALHDAGIGNELLVLEGASTHDGVEAAQAAGFVLMVHSAEQAELLQGRTVGVWLKVDTGMHRLGLAPQEVRDVLGSLDGADVRAICTHLACADELDNDATQRQLAAFEACTAGIDLPRSIANSAGILAWPASHADWNRPGIMLYGVSPLVGEADTAAALRPAMTLESEIIAIREIAAGESVGYGARWTATRTSRIATVAAGYADGYPRHAPNGTPTYVNGHKAPLAGTVSMDMITLDLTDHPAAAIGDPVELWGPNVPVNTVAHHAKTIPYELLTRVTPRVPRLPK